MTSWADDPRSVSELFEVVLQPDSDAVWNAVGALHCRGSEEVLDRALILSRSKDASERARSADILGQLGVPDRTFPDQCFDALFHLLSDESAEVIFAAIFGIQHLDRDRAAPYILRFAVHQDDNIRYATAFALGAVDAPDAIATLLALMEDKDAEVRNWATFGVGQQSDADSDEIRAALTARLNDEDSDVRYEAICGLGRRGDNRALGFLKIMLHDDPDDFFAREAAAKLVGMEASGETGTVDLLGALQRRQRWNNRRAVPPTS